MRVRSSVVWFRLASAVATTDWASWAFRFAWLKERICDSRFTEMPRPAASSSALVIR